MVDLARFEAHRGTLMAIAYRMLGSSADAEDVVQDAWLRWQSTDHAAVIDARAWLSTTVSRICVDRLTSARARRETYPGTWLPEPVSTSAPLDVESISLGFLVLLERLSPLERAVFVLYQVFDYSHTEIAAALGTTEGASRQSFHRAKEHVAANRPRLAASRESHQRLLSAFSVALTSGDLGALAKLLARDATLHTDSGGRVRGAAMVPLLGRESIVRFFETLSKRVGVQPDQSFAVADVNGWPALVGRMGTAIHSITTVDCEGDEIVAIRSILNPEKLTLRHVD